MITIQETKINWIRKNKYQDLSVTLLIKKEDYTKEMEDKLFESCADWTSYTCVLLEFQSERQETEQDKISKLRQTLAYKMELYCNKENIDKWEELDRLYKRHNIISRTELTLQQLQNEIASYEAGLLL